ncbi:MAG: efflux RND transporter permease subunit [Bacteroidetes bacterium]|nr:efflux RND transporter permease subunit [Bacteroidota bacterium]
MTGKIISWSLKNRFLVVLVATALFLWGLNSMRHSRVDAIPDLSENQVIVFTEWNGRGPQVIEDQITYPLVTNLQSLPRVKYVRANSMFGMSFIYVIFEDDADVYEARTRVLERLNYASRLLPEGVAPTLGPDGTGVGHILWYTLEAPGMDLGELRALQDWYVKFGLQDVEGVSEVASFGGFQKQYEVTVDPNKLNAFRLGFGDVLQTLQENNNETGGRKFEMGGAGYIVKTTGYLGKAEEIEQLALKSEGNSVVRIKDVGVVQTTGESRTGIFDLNGEGEAVGGIVVMRYGANATEVIEKVRGKMMSVARGFPAGVKFNVVYDRSELVQEAITSVRNTLLEEMLVVGMVVIFFLFNWRGALSILIQIPVTVATSFVLLNAFGIESNIMSLTGIALAIGVIADNGIIMAENAHKHLSERHQQLNPSSF